MLLGRIKDFGLLIIFLLVSELLAIFVVFSQPSQAHESPPTTVRLTPQGSNAIAIQVSLDPRAVLAAFEDVDHDRYSALTSEAAIARLRDLPELLDNLLRVDGIGKNGSMTVKGLSDDGLLDLVVQHTTPASWIRIETTELLGPIVLRTSEGDGDNGFVTRFLSPGEVAEIIPATDDRRVATSVVSEYLWAGFDHILPKGLDHILFVIGLFLLSPALRPLLVQVSLFTFAHTVTLALASFGAVTIPAAVVEPLIAASIVFIAIENVYRSTLSRWRPFVVFGFGLLHGLGFASVLSEFGLPTEQFVIALLAFNVGVEIGQLAVLALCFLAVGLLLRKPWYRMAVSVPCSLVLAGVGLFWSIERITGAIV